MVKITLFRPAFFIAHLFGCFDSEPADLWAGGQKYAYRVALSRHFDLDVGFFPNIFGQMFFNALLRQMVLVGPRNSHHTPRGFVLILNQRICGAGGRNTPTE